MKRTILLVDDDVAVLLTLKAVLELHGYDVHTAASAVEAIEKLFTQSYDMVITDSRMETDGAGMEVIRAARQQANRPAIALLTAYPPMNGNWQREGVNSLLVKPIGTRDLVRKIEDLLAASRPESSVA